MKKQLNTLYLLLALVVTSPIFANQINDEQLLQNASIAHHKKDYAHEVAILKPLAQKGNATAQARLGFNYLYGQNITQDRKMAFKLLQQSANQHNALAMFGLFLYYQLEPNTMDNRAKALHWLEQSANMGNAQAQFTLGMMYLLDDNIYVPKRDINKAVSWLQKSADQHFAQAEFMLGTLYLQGQGVKEDGDKAIQLLKQASEHGDVGAIELFKQIADNAPPPQPKSPKTYNTPNIKTDLFKGYTQVN